MQITNATYRALLAAGAGKEVRAVVGGVTYSVAKIVSAKTTQALGKTSLPIGNCVAARLDLALWNAGSVPRMAEIELHVRLDDGETQSVWLHKGTYYVDTREYDAEDDVLTLHAFDAMLKTEQSYTQPGSQGTWPRTDAAVVADIAQRIGVTVDVRTTALMTKGYQVQYPGIRLEDGTPQYSADGALSMREVLGYIGVMYGGNWIISETGALRLVPLAGEPFEVRSEVVTASGPWTSPSTLVGGVLATGVGGGGGGGKTASLSTSYGGLHAQGGGAGSGLVVTALCAVLQGQTVNVSIGAGGAKATAGSAEDGGDTSFGTFLTASGGYAGMNGETTTAPLRAVGGRGGDGYKGGGGGHSRISILGATSVLRTARGGDGGDAQDGTRGSPGDVSSGTGSTTRFADGGDGAGGASGGKNNTPPKGGAGLTLSDGNTYGAGGDAATAGSSGALELDYLVVGSGAQPLTVNVSTLNTSPALDPVSRVTLVLGTDSDGAEVSYTSGTDTGRELRAVCPWGTQAMTDDLLAALGGYAYQPFEASDALLDPAAELGDGIAVGSIVSQIMSVVTTYDALYTADIGAPQDEEIDHEYPYQPRQNREVAQKLATTSAQLRVDVDSIEAEVSGKIDETEAKTLISQGINGITLSASAGSNQSTVSIKSDGITVDSAVVQFSNIVADSVSASNITAGTINAANQTLNLKGALKVYTPDGTLVGEIGGHEDAILRAAWLTDRISRATFMAVETSGTTGTAIIGGDEIQLRLGPIRLDSSVHYGTSAPDSSTPGYGTEGALYFKI